MKLVTYKRNHQGFCDRQMKTFEKFPSKEEYQKLGYAAVCHPIGTDKIELHKGGNYNPLYIVE